jgi:hypothetical protein
MSPQHSRVAATAPHNLTWGRSDRRGFPQPAHNCGLPAQCERRRLTRDDRTRVVRAAAPRACRAHDGVPGLCGGELRCMYNARVDVRAQIVRATADGVRAHRARPNAGRGHAGRVRRGGVAQRRVTRLAPASSARTARALSLTDMLADRRCCVCSPSSVYAAASLWDIRRRGGR